MRLTGRARLSWGIIAITVLMVGAVWATHVASAQSSPAVSSPPVVGASQPSANLVGAGKVIVSRSSALTSYPVGCCASGSPFGVTVTGQATVRAAGSAARASAIARAVADAAGQAKAAASAAGISLGRVINMQVSAPYYPYPLPMGAAAGRASCVTGAPGATGATGAPGASGSGGAGPSAVPCSDLSQCPGYPCVSTYASVTITWAIA
jgi:Protein of unknown function (DUF541)